MSDRDYRKRKKRVPWAVIVTLAALLALGLAGRAKAEILLLIYHVEQEEVQLVRV